MKAKHSALAMGLALTVGLGVGSGVMAKTTVKVWGWEKELQTIANDYNKSHPDVEVKIMFMDWQSVHDKLLATMVAGTGTPDVTMCDVKYITRYLNQRGLFLSLDAYGAQSLKDKFVDSRWRLASLKGKIYALPIDIGPIALWYRPAVLAAAGLPVELGKLQSMSATWAQFMGISRKIVRDTDGDGKNDTFSLSTGKMIANIAAQQAGARMFDENLKVMIDNEDLDKWVEAWKVGKSFKDSGLESTIGYRWEGSMPKYLRQNKLAFAAEAVWYGGQDIAKIPGGWGVLPLPTGAGANEGGSFMAIPAGAKNKKEAYKFIQWLCANEDTQIRLLKSFNWFPALKSCYDDPYMNQPAAWSSNQSYLKVFTQMAINTKYMPVSRFDQKATDILSTALTKVWAGNDVSISLKDAAKAIRAASRGAI